MSPIKTHSRSAIYPWATMKVGDSFLVPATASGKKPVVPHVSSAGKRYQGKFSARRLSDGSVRVWRIK